MRLISKRGRVQIKYHHELICYSHERLTHSLREPGGRCTKSMEVSESRMEPVNK